MKFALSALPLLLAASVASAHGTGSIHHHAGDPFWMPLLGGLFFGAAAVAYIAWGRK